MCRGNWSWLLDPQFRDELTRPDAPNWLALEETCGTGFQPVDRAKLVKAGHHRQVWRVKLGRQTVYAKLFKSRGWANRLLTLLRMAKAQREWRALLQASNKGVPTVHPLALALFRDSHGSQAVLITAEYGQGRSLTQAWQEQTSHDQIGIGTDAHKRNQRALVEAVSELFARAHDAGMLHRDAHPKNIVVATAPDGRFEAVFADLYGSRFKKNLSLTVRAETLAQLDQYCHRIASVAQRLRFLRSYLKQASGFAVGSSRAEMRALVEAIIKARRRRSNALARQRNHRLRGHNKYFARIALPGRWRATVVLTLARRHVFPEPLVPDRTRAQWLTILESIGKQFDGELVHCGTGFQPVKSQVTNLCHNVPDLKWQQAHANSLWQRLGWTIFGSPLHRQFVAAHRNRHRDIDSPLYLAILQHRRFFFVDRSVLIQPGSSNKT